MTEIIGIDQSLTSTGIAVGDDTFTIVSKLKGVERLDDIVTQIMDVVRPLAKPHVYIEGYSFSSRNSHAHALGELGGCIRLELWRDGVPFTEIPPTVRAKFATGRGNSSKNEVVSSVSARTGIVWSGKGADDKCDAWILQEIGLYLIGQQRHDWPAKHTESLQTYNQKV